MQNIAMALSQKRGKKMNPHCLNCGEDGDVQSLRRNKEAEHGKR